MKNGTMTLQSYLLCMISNQLYKLVTDPNSEHSEIAFDTCIHDDSIKVEELESELKKSWIFKDMCPKLIKLENSKILRAELSFTTVKEIIDNCVVFRHFRDKLDKVSVRESEFNYRVFMELNEEPENEIRDNLALHGVNIYEDSIDQDINTDDLEVCVHLKNDTYIVRTKKK